MLVFRVNDGENKNDKNGGEGNDSNGKSNDSNGNSKSNSNDSNDSNSNSNSNNSNGNKTPTYYSPQNYFKTLLINKSNQSAPDIIQP